MKSSFENLKLKDISKIYSGNSINEKIKEQKYTGLENGVEYISTKDISFNSEISYDNGVKIPFNELDNFKTAPTNTVFICAEGGSAGRKLAISDRELCFVNKLFAVAASKLVLPKYLFYSLKTEDFIEQFNGSMTGIIGGVSLNKFRELEIKVPSISIQQKIVAKLEAIFAEIDTATAAAEANVNNAEALFQSYLTKVFERGGEGWERKTIEEITDKTKNVSPDKSPDIEFTYVDVSSISNTSYSIISTQKLLGKDAPSRAKKNIITNDVLFATVRPTLKRIAIVPEFLENQVASTGYVVLRTNKKNYHKFLFYFLFTTTFNEAMESLQRGASYPAVTDSDVKLQKLLVPSYEEQYKISEKIEQINSSISIKINSELRKIEELKALKQAILQKAFSGELVKD